MKQIRISPQLALPLDVAGEAIAILAKRGAGKTNTATVLVEEIHGAGVQVVILDPVGAWWGLRSSADGKKAGLGIPIFGGQHADVPLEPTAGVLMADTAVETAQSLLLDLSDFPSKASTARFVVDFAERLFRAKNREKSLLHLVLEEADTFAPQNARAEEARMAGAIEQIVRRGRGRGLGITMVTQRSAVLNKDVLSQADVLIAMRTTSPHDTDAIKKWVAAHGDDERGVIASLPGLETGEAWFWNPERGLLDRVKVRRRRTFDSSSSPKAGERRAEPERVASIDLEKLGAQIKATAEQAKANDPVALRQRIHALEQQTKRLDDMVKVLESLKEAAPPEPVVERVEVPALSEGQVGRLEGIVADLRDVAKAVEGAAGEVHRELSRIAATSVPAPASGREAPQRALVERPRPRRPEPIAPRPEPAVGSDGFSPSGPQQRILNALAALEAIGIADANKTQLALFAEASPRSSSYTNNLGTLRTSGLIAYPGPQRVALTAAGRACADASAAPTSTAELHDFVYGLVGGAKGRLLEVLIAESPRAVAKAELAERAGASATSSSFSNNLGSLRSLGLVDYPQPGYVAALPVLFLDA